MVAIDFAGRSKRYSTCLPRKASKWLPGKHATAEFCAQSSGMASPPSILPATAPLPALMAMGVGVSASALEAPNVANVANNKTAKQTRAGIGHSQAGRAE